MTLIKILSVLFFFSADSSFASNTQDCTLKSGKGSVVSKVDGCSYSSKNSKAGSAFVVYNKIKWTPKSENIYTHLRVNDLQSLKGLEFRFFSNTKEVLRYSFPLFKIKDFNIIQNNKTAQISFPLSSSKVFTSLENVKVDSVGVFTSSQGGRPLNLTFSNFKISKRVWQSGAVSFTFDDGYKSQLKAFALMKKHNIPGTAFIIPEALNSVNYMNWDDVRMLSQWGWDISTHHQTPITKTPNSKLKSILQETKKALYTKGLPKKNTRTIAYPLGLTNQKSLAQIKGAFDFGRLASGGSESLPIPNPLKIKTFNVLNTTKPDEIFKLVKSAQAHGDWVVLMFHYFDQPDKGELNYSTSDLKTLITKLKSINANIVPMSTVLDNKSSSLN